MIQLEVEQNIKISYDYINYDIIIIIINEQINNI